MGGIGQMEPLLRYCCSSQGGSYKWMVDCCTSGRGGGAAGMWEEGERSRMDGWIVLTYLLVAIMRSIHAALFSYVGHFFSFTPLPYWSKHNSPFSAPCSEVARSV